MSEILRPKVINLRHTHHRASPGATRVDRATKWGNPFIIGKHGTRAEVIAKYREWLHQQVADGALDLKELRGRDLACWCAPLPCHGDILLELSNE